MYNYKNICFLSSPTVLSEEQQQSASENGKNGVIQTKPPRYLTREETQNEDKESLVRNEAPLSTRDAYEEPPSDEEGNDSSLGRKGVHPSSTASREKKAMSTSAQHYEDVNLVRARKAKQREQKMKEQQKQQAKQQKQAKQKTVKVGINCNIHTCTYTYIVHVHTCTSITSIQLQLHCRLS